MTLKKFNPRKLVIFSRDEMKQWDMAQEYKDDGRVKFIIGDVRDRASLRRAVSGIEYVVHAAATKIVPTAEYNPFECIKTNIDGAMNVVEACIDQGVAKVVALSTDKASNPVNLYGATKLASDKLFIASNPFENEHKTIFSVVRYGNVMGSRGSVIPFFLSKYKDSNEPLPITDPRMTRFMISLDQAVELVWTAFGDMGGGEVYVKKIPSMNILKIAEAIAPDRKTIITGIRPGEKIHEQMIGLEDAPHTFEYEGYYKILPAIHGISKDSVRIRSGLNVPENFSYDSGSNSNWMSVDDLRAWVKKSGNGQA